MAEKGIFSKELPELLTLLGDDITDAAVGEAMRLICDALAAARVYLLRFDVERQMIRFVGEARREGVVAFDPGFEYPVADEPGWDLVRDDNWIIAPNVNDPETIAKYGLRTEVNTLLGIRSLYCVRFTSGGINWGSLGIAYDGDGHVLEEEEWLFLKTSVKVLQQAIERSERLVALREERDRAKAAEAAKSFFFSTVSHDIRTPLNAIVGYAELLKLGVPDEEERKKAIDSVLVSSRMLLELINDVLDLSKLEAGRMDILPEPVDFQRLVLEVASAFRASLGEKPVEIITEVHRMPWLRLDPHRVRQILFNLVGNAVKFTEKGHVAIRASYAPGEGNSGVLSFEVDDTGCGISEEDQERIAQPYVQVGNARSRNAGTGLGLAICRQLVTKMNGDIELQSLVGCGTTFFVTIPAEAEEDKLREARLSATQKIRFVVSQKPKSYSKVLLVDDQPMNLMVLKTMLTRFDVPEVITAGSAREALEILDATDGIDLILTDMWMPGMDGDELVAEIRRNQRWNSIPVYAVTADVEAQKDYREQGFSGILLKPLTLEKLRDILVGPAS